MNKIDSIPYSETSAGDLWLPDGPGPVKGHPVVLVIHGGARTSLDKNSMSGVSELLCSNGFAVFNIDYRLAPEHPYPAGWEDCRAAARFLTESAGEYLLDPDLLFIAGASAGGHYALLTGLRPAGYRVAGVVSISGINDIYADWAVHEERYQLLLGEKSPSAALLEEINPSTYCAKDAPAVFCTHFAEDQVVPWDCCRLFAEKARQTGMEVGIYCYHLNRENQGHGIWIPEELPEKKLYPEIGEKVIHFLKHKVIS